MSLINCIDAGVAELADAYGSGPYERKFMQVQVLSPAPGWSDKIDVTPFLFDFKRLSAVFKNNSHTTFTVDVQGTLRPKAGFPAWFIPGKRPRFFVFSPFSRRKLCKSFRRFSI